MDDDTCGDPRLGWLEAFVATAVHLDYQAAANELSVSPSSAKRSVEKLELWLHKLLILDDGPPELYQPDGLPFLAVAQDVLQVVHTFSQDLHAQGHTGRDLIPNISVIRLSELESLLSICALGNYKSAAFELEISADQVRRNVKKLEHIFGCALVAGRTRIEATSEGSQFVAALKGPLAAMRASVAAIPHQQPLQKEIQVLWMLALRRYGELSVLLERTNKKRRPMKLDKIQTQAAEKEIATLRQFLSAFRGRIVRSGGAALDKLTGGTTE